MFRPSNEFEIKNQLIEVCTVCNIIQSKTRETDENICLFLSTEKKFKNEDVLWRFVYALACDYFFNITNNFDFSDMATAAYADAILAFQNNPTGFQKIQLYFQKAKAETCDAYKKKLYDFLSRFNGGRSTWPSNIPPSALECSEALNELSQNLHLFEGKTHEIAVELVNKANELFKSNPQMNQFPFEKLLRLATELYASISYRDHYEDYDHLISQFSKLDVGIHSDKFQLSVSPENFWLIHDLLMANNIPTFILGLTSTLQHTRSKDHGMKRPHLLENTKTDDIDISDAVNTFQRRMVRAKRFGATPKSATSPTSMEIGYTSSHEESSDIQQAHKRKRF